MTTEFNPFSLKDKTILVTGASSGIGKATAILCSSMGARVIVSGRNKIRLQETFDALIGTDHKAIAADLTLANERERLCEAVPALDGLVH